MLNPLARKTVSRIEQALGDEQTSAISEIIQIIQQISARAFSISVLELAEIIGSDPTITEKVISAANTLGFKHGGAQIGTIAEAIHKTGFEKIRNLAISLMLTDNANKNVNGHEQREMAAIAVCSGLLSTSIITEKDSSIDPDLLFVCTSLRNYGKLIMASFLVDEYRTALGHALDMSEDAAFSLVFGLTPLALSRHLLKSGNLPKNVMASIQEVPDHLLDRSPTDSDQEILLAAAFSVEIGETTFNNAIKPEEFNDALMNTISKFQKSFPVSLETVNQALLNVNESMSELNRVIGVSDDASSASRKLQARVNGNTLPLPPKKSQIKAIPKKKSFSEMDSSEREEFAENSFQQAVGSITKLLVPGERVDLKEVYQTASKTIMESLNLENCLVFVCEEFEPMEMSARHGYGPLLAKIKNRPLVTSKNKDVFSICLVRREDILIQDTTVGKIKSVIPDWIHSLSDTSSLILLPISIGKECFSIIVGTVSNKRTIKLEEGDLRRLRVMRTHLASLMQMIHDNEIVAV